TADSSVVDAWAETRRGIARVSAQSAIGRHTIDRWLARHAPAAAMVSLDDAVLRARQTARAAVGVEVAQLPQVAGRLFEVHLALADGPSLEDVGDLDHQPRLAANQQLEADLEAPGRDRHAARPVPPHQEEPGRRV